MPVGIPDSEARNPLMIAALDLLPRSGAKEVQVRYDEEQDPIVWVATARWEPAGQLCGCGFTPARALVSLAENAFDGGLCAHCGKPSGVTEEWREEMPLATVLCWYVYDPETQRFRRSCEGETVGRAFGRDPKTGAVVGRNDPCPCGSGKKWKRCHGAG